MIEEKEKMKVKINEMSKVRKMLMLELGILILVLIVFLVIKYRIVNMLPKCIVYEFFGIQCPSCGATRCVINFIFGNWKESFIYHPIFFITIWYLLLVNVLYIINCLREKKILKWMYPKFKFWIIWTIILVIFTIIRNII